MSINKIDPTLSKVIIFPLSFRIFRNMILNTEAQLPILREAPILRVSAAMVPDSSLLTLNPSQQSRTANTAKPILRQAPIIKELSEQLTESLRHPNRRTLTLINKALSYLSPFESPLATVTSTTERRDLIDLLQTHRLTLSPYLDLDRIERNLCHRH